MFEEFITHYEDFIFMDDEPEKADIIFVPGNGYPQMAEHAAQLYRDGYAPLIMPSGKFSVVAQGFAGVLAKKNRYDKNYHTECDFLTDVLLSNGVPDTAIIKEERATYTWENAKFSAELVKERGLKIKKAILCCKTHHARRAFMYYQKAFRDTKIIVCPSNADGITKDNWRQTEEGIDSVTGEMTRIIRQFSLFM